MESIDVSLTNYNVTATGVTQSDRGSAGAGGKKGTKKRKLRSYIGVDCIYNLAIYVYTYILWTFMNHFCPSLFCCYMYIAFISMMGCGCIHVLLCIFSWEVLTLYWSDIFSPSPFSLILW